jgi:hypothetical protein
MFWFGKKLTEWGTDICAKMLSAMDGGAYGGYIEQINSGLIKKVIPVPLAPGNYGFELNAELYEKYMRPSAPEFVLTGFKLSNDSGKFADGRIYFRNGIISSFFVKSRINTAILSVSTKNVWKQTLLDRLPENIMEIICQYDGIDISAVHRVDIEDRAIYHLITSGDKFIGIEENGGAFVEVSNETSDVKPFTGPIADYLSNVPKEYRYEGLPKNILKIISLHDGIDIRDIYRVDIENRILYHSVYAEDGDFIGIDANDGNFVYATHDPLGITPMPENTRISKVHAGDEIICHLFDTKDGDFIGIGGGGFVEVSRDLSKIEPLTKGFRDYLTKSNNNKKGTSL